jgi:hypothetical protein
MSHINVVFALLFFVALAAISWTFALSKSTRRRFLRTQWYLFRMNKEQQETDDAVALAVSIVFALTVTMVLIGTLLSLIGKLF